MTEQTNVTEQTLARLPRPEADLGKSAIAPILAEISSEGGPRTDGDFNALAMLLIDSTLNGDEESLRSLQDWLRIERARCAGGKHSSDLELYGRLLGLIDVSHWALERALPLDDMRYIERGSHANRFLRQLTAEPGLANRELADRLGVDETQISRVGRRLRERGLVASRLFGRRNRWELTPKGLRTLQVLEGVHEMNDLSACSSDRSGGESGAANTAALESEEQVSETEAKEFAARLNRLFEALPMPGHGPTTSRDVITALKADGIPMTAPYLSQLRSGNRTPSASTVAALANFFRIKPAYFTDNEYYQKLDEELAWLAHMRDEGVRRIAARTVGLSSKAQQDIVRKVDEMRRKEHLDK